MAAEARSHAGATLQGVAINFVRSDDIRILRDIEQYYSTQIDEMPMVGCSASPKVLTLIGPARGTAAFLGANVRGVLGGAYHKP